MAQKLLLYSFRRCPYAMRTRFTLKLCKIPYDQIEVDFKNKPQELLELSPKGTVPVLLIKETGQVIDESLEIMHWALAQTSPCPLPINDNTKRLIIESDTDFKHHLDRFKYSTRYENVDPKHHKIEAEKFLSKLNVLLEKHDFLISNEPSLADVAIFPFIRQYANINLESFNTLAYPQLQKWLTYWINHPIFIMIMQK